MQSSLRSRIKTAVSRMRRDSAPADEQNRKSSIHSVRDSPVHNRQEHPDTIHTSDPRAGGDNADGGSESDLYPVTEKDDKHHHPGPSAEPHSNPSKANPGLLFQHLRPRDKDQSNVASTTLTQCEEPLNLEVDGEAVAIDTQIQLYATNGQLRHPWVSPVVGYLGGLPPLFICCGANEVLRDEIIYAQVCCQTQ